VGAADYQAVSSPWTQADMFIAATAAVHRLVLVTRNARDFEGCNLAPESVPMQQAERVGLGCGAALATGRATTHGKRSAKM
jgi:hypothetical protein